jgi:hypothetical protein
VYPFAAESEENGTDADYHGGLVSVEDSVNEKEKAEHDAEAIEVEQVAHNAGNSVSNAANGIFGHDC